MKSLWNIEAFCTVVERKSFVIAARVLGASPSAVTRAVQALENELNTLLLARSPRQFSLTPAGELYYESARQMLHIQETADEALSQLRAAPRGWLRLAAPQMMSCRVLPDVLATLSVRYPELRFDIRYSDATLDPAQEQLDLVIRGAFPIDSDLIGYPLWPYHRHLYASPAYGQRLGFPEEPETLGEHVILMHTAPRILRSWNFLGGGRQISLNMRASHRIDNGLALLAATEAGLGIARLSDWVAEPLVRQGRLCRVCSEYRLVSARGEDPQMHAVAAQRRLPARTRLLIDALIAQRPALNPANLGR
ncbi:MAG: LysR family transcriptional regulator [Paludibacterium sp.]|uniref:LysR family transcriptional regulator n=1 Tax=Paludibacterium sp. TaxID=1917523 RepID=UPI0025F37FE1|nr:LysR family transcriptional regulator [Paludibacterium sp.]MBV8046623.1 LysR family transcriptional regulator [Paludibacterium sp.]MBV8647648.1 LysR family transcriptional regulator [Paludibacterium sp.]